MGESLAMKQNRMLREEAGFENRRDDGANNNKKEGNVPGVGQVLDSTAVLRAEASLTPCSRPLAR